MHFVHLPLDYFETPIVSSSPGYAHDKLKFNALYFEFSLQKWNRMVISSCLYLKFTNYKEMRIKFKICSRLRVGAIIWLTFKPVLAKIG